MDERKKRNRKISQEMNLVPVKDNPGWYRDMNTGAIINNSESHLFKVRKRRELINKRKEKEYQKDKKIDELEKKVDNLTDLIERLLEKE